MLPTVPPQWILEPSDTSISLGGSTILHCLAKGFPEPHIKWKKQGGAFV